MRTVKVVVATLIAVAVLIPLAALGIIYSGVYNVAATREHGAVAEWLLNQTVRNSVAARAEDIDVPELGARRQVLSGAANYAAMCVGCHGAPGVEQGLPAIGMYPRPPRLDQAAKHMTPAQLFWVIGHGIKFTGMPAWGPWHSDKQLWSLVAFVEQLPRMSPAEYQQLLQAASASDAGHHASGDEAHGGTHGHGAGTGHAEGAASQRPPAPADAAKGAEGHTHGAGGHSH